MSRKRPNEKAFVGTLRGEEYDLRLLFLVRSTDAQ